MDNLYNFIVLLTCSIDSTYQTPPSILAYILHDYLLHTATVGVQLADQLREVCIEMIHLLT